MTSVKGRGVRSEIRVAMSLHVQYRQDALSSGTGAEKEASFAVVSGLGS